MKQCLRTRVVMNKDRISELPEALILHILSSLPTKDVIVTSVLSKRWRSLWKFVSKLEFDSANQDIASFSENVGKFLLLHKAPALESLHLKVTDKEKNRCDLNVGVWAGIAIARNVRELVLDLLFERSVRFPSCLFSFNTLETLILKYSILVDVPSPICMKSLRTLHLVSVVFNDNGSIRNLISGCPNLEDLVMHRGKVLLIFVIRSPSLKRLSITETTDGLQNGGYVINTPSLKYLKIKGFSHCLGCLIEDAPVLVDANISNVSYVINEKIMGSITSAKRLSLNLSPLEIKCPTGAIFYRLVYLQMCTDKAEWWNLLTIMLDSSPKLQALKLIDQNQDSNKDSVVGGKWSEPKYVPQCLLSHLETFVWTRYDWRRQEEKEVATYILRNAIRLKKATFSIRPLEELNELEERRVKLKELNGVVRASNSCHLVFDFECYIEHLL